MGHTLEVSYWWKKSVSKPMLHASLPSVRLSAVADDILTTLRDVWSPSRSVVTKVTKVTRSGDRVR